MYALHHPIPRHRQPSSTPSTLLSSGSAGSSDAWMPPATASTSTSRSIFSDGEDTQHKYRLNVIEGDGSTEIGTVVDKFRERDERPLIDLGDGYDAGDEDKYGVSSNDGRTRAPGPQVPAATPGDKLRLLLRQMEAEVRNTTPAPPPPVAAMQYQLDLDHEYEDENEESRGEPTPIPSRSHWREGRRIGALPKERSYSPELSTTPPRRPSIPQTQIQMQRDEEEEEMEVLEDSPPTPPLRITNPYLYNSRKVSDERRSQSPRMASRAAVLHASSSRSPPPPVEQPKHSPTPLESYLARAPTSPPSRKGKERAQPSTFRPARTPARTPRRWSVELAPEDSVIFAQGAQDLEVNQEEVELDLDESAEPPWMGEEEDTEEDIEEEGGRMRGSGSRSREDVEGKSHELPALPELGTSYEDSEDGGERHGETYDQRDQVPTAPPPAVRPRSRFSRSRSVSHSRSNSRISHSQTRYASLEDSPSRSEIQSQSHSAETPSFTTAKTSSPFLRPDLSAYTSSPSSSRLRREVPPVQPISYPQEPIRVGTAFTSTSTPPRAETHARVGDNTLPGQTPKPPGAWYSASKPRHTPQVKFSPSPLRHTYTKGESSSSILKLDESSSVHRLKLSPRKPKSPKSPDQDRRDRSQEDTDTSFTKRLVSMSKYLSTRSQTPPPQTSKPIPEPSTTLIEARAALAKAAEASAMAQRKVESSQRQWLDALALSSGSMDTTVAVLKSGVTWGRWGWWLSMEILLLWGVFRVTLEYAQMTQFQFLDPSLGSSMNAMALSIPLPTAISAFVIPPLNRRGGGSANFFDLVERLLSAGAGVGDESGWMRVPA